MLHIAYFSS